MKVLIWIGTLFIATVLNVALGEMTGFRAGYVVVYVIVGFVARKLCKMWDDRQSRAVSIKEIQENSKVAKQAKIDSESAKIATPETVHIESDDLLKQTKEKEMVNPNIQQMEIAFCRKCGAKLIPGSEFCSKCGTAILKKDCSN